MIHGRDKELLFVSNVGINSIVKEHGVVLRELGVYLGRTVS